MRRGDQTQFDPARRYPSGRACLLGGPDDELTKVFATILSDVAIREGIDPAIVQPRGAKLSALSFASRRALSTSVPTGSGRPGSEASLRFRSASGAGSLALSIPS